MKRRAKYILAIILALALSLPTPLFTQQASARQIPCTQNGSTKRNSEMEAIFSQGSIMFFDECAQELNYCENDNLREVLSDTNGNITNPDGQTLNCNTNNVTTRQKDPASSIVLSSAKVLEGEKILPQLTPETLSDFTRQTVTLTTGENNLANFVAKLNRNSTLRKNIIINLAYDGTPSEVATKEIEKVLNEYPVNEFIFVVSDDTNNTLHAAIDKNAQTHYNIKLVDWQKISAENSHASLASLIFDAVPGGLQHTYDNVNESYLRNAMIDQEIDNLSNDKTNIALMQAEAKNSSNINPFSFNPVSRTVGIFGYHDETLIKLMEENFGKNFATEQHGELDAERAIRLQVNHYFSQNTPNNAYKTKNLAYINESNAIKSEKRQENYILADKYQIWYKYYDRACEGDINSSTRINSLAYSYYRSYSNQNPYITALEDYYYDSVQELYAYEKNNLVIVDGWIAGGANNVVRVASSELSPNNAESYFSEEYRTANTYTNTSANKITIFLDEQENKAKTPHFAVDSKSGTIYQYRDIRYSANAVDDVNEYAGVEIAVVNADEDEMLADEFATNLLTKLTEATALDIALEYDSPSYFEPKSQIAKNDFKNYSGIVVSGQTTAFKKPSLVRYGSYLKGIMLP